MGFAKVFSFKLVAIAALAAVGSDTRSNRGRHLALLLGRVAAGEDIDSALFAEAFMSSCRGSPGRLRFSFCVGRRKLRGLGESLSEAEASSFLFNRRASHAARPSVAGGVRSALAAWILRAFSAAARTVLSLLRRSSASKATEHDVPRTRPRRAWMAAREGTGLLGAIVGRHLDTRGDVNHMSRARCVYPDRASDGRFGRCIVSRCSSCGKDGEVVAEMQVEASDHVHRQKVRTRLAPQNHRVVRRHPMTGVSADGGMTPESLTPRRSPCTTHDATPTSSQPRMVACAVLHNERDIGSFSFEAEPPRPHQFSTFH